MKPTIKTVPQRREIPTVTRSHNKLLERNRRSPSHRERSSYSNTVTKVTKTRTITSTRGHRSHFTGRSKNLHRGLGHRPQRPRPVTQKNITNINNTIHVHNHNKIIKKIHWPRYRFSCHYRYNGYYDSIYTHIISPRHFYRVKYYIGPRIVHRYCYPRHHRKYVFVSVGSCWPRSIYSVRYYRYGYHPFVWYGSYPIGYEVKGPTYNYYTYNYGSYNGEYSTSSSTLPPVDETTFADVRQRITVTSPEPDPDPKPETLADKYFDRGVEAFEDEDYERAVTSFADAMVLEPEDNILPFTYVQALFASEQYNRAAQALRIALEALPPDQLGIFFPRGLYKDDEILLDQVEELGKKAGIFSYDPDLALLLGYQLLGIEEYDLAKDWLEHSQTYFVNRVSADVLLKLLEKIDELSKQ